eukprot:c1021_g1_i1 orf=1-234(-)
MKKLQSVFILDQKKERKKIVCTQDESPRISFHCKEQICYQSQRCSFQLKLGGAGMCVMWKEGDKREGTKLQCSLSLSL